MYRKNCYRNGSSRGGTSPKATDTSFKDNPNNKHKSPKAYWKIKGVKKED